MGNLERLSLCSVFIFNIIGFQRSLAAEGVECRNNTDYISPDGAPLDPVLEEYEAALLILVIFGGFSIAVALIYNYIRRCVYKDVQSVDSSFDAGGNVSASLTAVAFAGNLLWPGDIMQSVTFAIHFGIAGAFWYCAAPLINMSLFPLLSFKFKTRAPGAKTYLQIILARAGRPTHVLFCVYALLMNAVIMSTILVGGVAVMQATIKDVSPEFCLLVIVTLCGSYTLVGGLGASFYVSYFNVLVTFVSVAFFVFKIVYSADEPFGSLEEIYTRVNCMPEMPGNRDGSRFTFISEDALIMATQSLFLVSSVAYCDQATWQSRVAAKPLPGAIGILFGALIWFSLPASIGLVTGMTYLSETALNHTMALSTGQIDSGVVSTYMAQKLLGSSGVYMMLIVIIMLTMSTGSREIIAVSSILVYDVYQTYINPYRSLSFLKECVLCGKVKCNQDAGSDELLEKTNDNSNSGLVCVCPSVVSCLDCKRDVKNTYHSSRFPGNVVSYECRHHGHYRTYQDTLNNVKSWCMLWVTVLLIPYGLFLYVVEVDLNWIMFTGAILLVPSFPGVIMSITWSKVTPIGLVIGSVTGFCCGVGSNLLMAYLYYDGEGGFFVATSMPYAVLAGSGIGGTVSLVLTALVSLLTHKIKTTEDEDEVWQKLRNIDNPLQPWSQQFANDFPELGGLHRPVKKQLEHLHRHGRMVSIVGFVLIFIFLVVLVAGVMLSLEVLSFDEFHGWIIFITVWLLLAAVILIIVTPIQEVYNILKTMKSNTSIARKKNDSSPTTRDVDAREKGQVQIVDHGDDFVSSEEGHDQSHASSIHDERFDSVNKKDVSDYEDDENEGSLGGQDSSAPVESNGGRQNEAFQDDDGRNTESSMTQF